MMRSICDFSNRNIVLKQYFAQARDLIAEKSDKRKRFAYEIREFPIVALFV